MHWSDRHHRLLPCVLTARSITRCSFIHKITGPAAQGFIPTTALPMLPALLKVLPLYLLCSSTSVLRASAQSPDSVLNDDFTAFIDQLLTDWNSPGGVAVAVVRQTEQGTWNVETKGYGVAKGDGSKVDENTLFAIASNSKLFNVFATGLLINNETLTPRLSWTSKLASVIPSWGLQDSTAYNQSTILDLMSHRTGLPRHDFSYRWSDDVPAVIEKVKAQRPSAEFRDVFQYTNNMYTLLSYLPPLLLPSKTPFTRYVKEHIFEPLGMNSTTYSFERANGTGNLADGFAVQMTNGSGDPFGNGTVRVLPYWSPEGGEDGNVLSGAGGIISNAVDLATWLQTLLLNGVNPNTNQSVIPADVVNTVAVGVSVALGQSPFPELSPVVYGGGQIRGTYRGHEFIEHNGGVTGFYSQISRLPFDNVGVAVLTNDDRVGDLVAEIIQYRLLDVALGLDPIDWNGRFKDIIAASPVTPATPRSTNATPPARNFADLAGTYDNAGYGSIELCLVSEASSPDASPTCQALAADAPTILPGAVNPDIPTFLVDWNGVWASHIRITHFDGNLFNLSSLQSLPTGDVSSPYWAYPSIADGLDTGAILEFAVLDDGDAQQKLGLSLRGIWGAGAGVDSPIGNDVRERAEVWFDRV